MKAKIIFAVFVLLLVAQAAVPIGLIVKSESIATSGQLLKFKCRPVDPRDLFRGRYLQLNFELTALSVPAEELKNLSSADEDFDTSFSSRYYNGAYLQFKEDAQGYAELSAAPQLLQPKGTAFFLKASCRANKNKEAQTYNITATLPFTRFYMNEVDAPEVEKAYNKATRDAQSETYLLVAIKDGRYAVLDLFINGVSAKQIAKNAEASKAPAASPPPP